MKRVCPVPTQPAAPAYPTHHRPLTTCRPRPSCFYPLPPSSSCSCSLPPPCPPCRPSVLHRCRSPVPCPRCLRCRPTMSHSASSMGLPQSMVSSRARVGLASRTCGHGTWGLWRWRGRPGGVCRWVRHGAMSTGEGQGAWGEGDGRPRMGQCHRGRVKPYGIALRFGSLNGVVYG